MGIGREPLSHIVDENADQGILSEIGMLQQLTPHNFGATMVNERL
jgi:hypothetical protein